MRVFTYEFEIFVKGAVFCSWRGHKMPHRWQQTMWAPGHLGNRAKFCERCGKKLKEEVPKWLGEVKVYEEKSGR